MIHIIYSHPMALDRIRILFEVTNERISQIFNQILLGAVRCEGKIFSPSAAGHRPYQRPRSVHCTLPPTPAVSAREHSQRPPSRAKLFEAFHFRGLLGHRPIRNDSLILCLSLIIGRGFAPQHNIPTPSVWLRDCTGGRHNKC